MQVHTIPVIHGVPVRQYYHQEFWRSSENVLHYVGSPENQGLTCKIECHNRSCDDLNLHTDKKQFWWNDLSLFPVFQPSNRVLRLLEFRVLVALLTRLSRCWLNVSLSSRIDILLRQKGKQISLNILFRYCLDKNVEGYTIGNTLH